MKEKEKEKIMKKMKKMKEKMEKMKEKMKESEDGGEGGCTPEVVAIKKTRVIPVAVPVKGGKRTFAIKIPQAMMRSKAVPMAAPVMSHPPPPPPMMLPVQVSAPAPAPSCMTCSAPITQVEEVVEEVVEEEPEPVEYEYAVDDGWGSS